MDSKKWYMSKTLWVNMLAAAIAGLQAYKGGMVNPELQVAIVAALNMYLRKMTTKPITK